MKAMLLAAGEGQRLRPHTLIQPKPAIPFLNVPLACFAMELLLDAGIQDLTVNTYHLPEKVHALFNSLSSKLSSLHFSDEKTLMGSGGGIDAAKRYLIGGENFIVVNADEVMIPHQKNFFSDCIQAHRKSEALATLMVKDHPGVGTEFGGAWANAQNQIALFSKTKVPDANLKGWHFIGPIIFSDRAFQYIPENRVSNILYECLTAAIQKGEKVCVYPTACDWYETGNPKDFLLATESFLKMNSPYAIEFIQAVWARFAPGTKIHRDATATVVEGRNCQFDLDSIKGFAVIGDNSIVEAGARLENCVIGSGVKITKDQNLKNAIILT